MNGFRFTIWRWRAICDCGYTSRYYRLEILAQLAYRLHVFRDLTRHLVMGRVGAASEDQLKKVSME